MKTHYIVYKKSNENLIRTKYSSDGGDTWSYLNANPANSNANSIESVYSNEKLHITFQISNSIKYRFWDGSNWSIEHTVSTGENGTMPRITAWYTGTQDRVYFLYRKNSSESRWREYNATTNNWVNNPLPAFTTTAISYPAGFAVDDNYIYSFYSFEESGDSFFQYNKRRKSDNALLFTAFMDQGNLTFRVFSTATTDGIVHSSFWHFNNLSENEFPGIHRALFDGTGGINIDLVYWDNNLLPNEIYNTLNLSSASNDVYVIWQDNIGGNNLRLIYDDAAPLTPSNFAGTTYNNHPKLTWTLNNDPDISGYEIYRLLTTGSGVFELLTTVSSGTSSYIDNGVQLGGTTMGRVFYKIRAKDNHPYYSGYTPVIRYNYSGLNKSTAEHQSFEYRLSANYPNPFNPTTQIKYSLAQDADVTLKVYDMLGTEVAALVNETQEAGNHTVNFNASNLSSSVYIYRITATYNGRILFTDSKQMILLR